MRCIEWNNREKKKHSVEVFFVQEHTDHREANQNVPSHFHSRHIMNGFNAITTMCKWKRKRSRELKPFYVRDIGEKTCAGSFLHRGGVGGTVTSWACCESFAEILFLKERGKRDKEARCCPHSVISDGSVAARKVLPYFWSEEVRGWGGKVCLRRPQLCVGLLLGVFPDPPGRKQLSGQSQSLTYLDGWTDGGMEGEKKSAQHIFIHMLRVHREISHRKIPPCSIGLLLVFFFFMSGRLAINICCSPAWLREDIYCRIDACFLQYCSNFL